MKKSRIAAGALTAVIVTGNVFTSYGTVFASVKNGSGKEEVVYIMTDAEGNTENVNVVNIFGKGSVTDYGSYSSVKMLNTTDGISMSGDAVTFSTDKDKVYYQGTLENAQIPWNISIVYTLDGKTVQPSELAGQSGELKINIKITKNDKSKTSFYDDYALQASLTLDTDKCRNIEADSATLANVGTNKQISYTVLPGKGLDAQISADVTDFEMDAVSINGVKLNLNVDIDDAELMSKVNDIMNATKSLNDGASELSDGSSQLVDGSQSLKEGTGDFTDGMNSLDSGIVSLSDGVVKMQAALDELNSHSAELKQGSSNIKETLVMIQQQLSAVSVSTEQLKQLVQSSQTIKQAINDLCDGAAALKESLSYDSYKNAMKHGGLDIDELQASNEAAVNLLSQQIAQLTGNVTQLKNIPGYEDNEQYRQQVLQLEAQIDSLSGIVTLLKGDMAAVGGVSQYMDGVSDGAGKLTDSLESLKANYEEFDAAINNLSVTLSGLMVNMSSLKNGIDRLTAAYGDFDTGLSNYTDGVAAVAASYMQLVSGTNELVSGSSVLADSAGKLRDGASGLYDGMTSMDSGVKELNNGTKEFYEQTDGMDEKISSAIKDMTDSISGGSSETVSFVSDKNKNVSSVQFVIKTDAVKKQEAVQTETQQTEKLNFWQKLVRLFVKNK